MPIPSLIVHGGASSLFEDEYEPSLEGVREAARVGWEILQKGGSALDAVEQAVRVMEDHPAFDAGLGSVLDRDGNISMDAIIMDGQTLNNGAVAAISQVANPVTVARLVMEKTRHSLLAGAGAERFAVQMGIEQVDQNSLIVGRELDLWQKKRQGSTTPAGHDTVGAVARDSAGNIAVATSTGGTAYKLPGRVGDSPLIGSGAYADNLAGGASATGVGETIMKVVLSKTACDLMQAGMTAQQAAEEGIKRLEEPRVQGSGGIIVIDKTGRIGFAHNTPHMPRAYVIEGRIQTEL